MPRRKLPGLVSKDSLVTLPAIHDSDSPDAPATVAEIIEELGAVELDPGLVPKHWLDAKGPDFAIFVEGVSRRPTWSPREAGKLAQAAVAICEMREDWNELGQEQGHGRVVSMPQFLSVTVCPRCNELKMGSSRADRRTDECDTCAVLCTKAHKSNQINCDECRSICEVLWTTNDPIPREWMI